MPPPPRLLRSAGLFICSSCRHAIKHNNIIAAAAAATAAARPISSTTPRLARQREIDDFYAQLLSEPLPTSARTTRSVFPTTPSEQQRQTPSPSPPSSSSSSSSSKSPSSSSTSPSSSSSSSSSSTRPPPKPLTVDSNPSLAARAQLVFGSRLVGPEERAARARDRDAAATLVAGVRVPPRPAEPDNCCMGGCVNCVWDLYREELEEWAARRREAAMATAGTGGGGDGVGVGGGGGGGGGGLASQQQVTGGAMGEAALSVDDDGGGSETNWDAEEALLPGSGSALFASVPVGIREFMRTEKRLGQKRRERERGGV